MRIILHAIANDDELAVLDELLAIDHWQLAIFYIRSYIPACLAHSPQIRTKIPTKLTYSNHWLVVCQ